MKGKRYKVFVHLDDFEGEGGPAAEAIRRQRLNPLHGFVCGEVVAPPGTPHQAFQALERARRFAADAKPGEIMVVDNQHTIEAGRKARVGSCNLGLRGREVAPVHFLEGYEEMAEEQKREEATKDRHNLLNSNVPQIEAAYTLSAATHGPDVVVIVADARSDLGEALSRKQYGDERHQTMLAEYQTLRRIPTVIVGFPQAVAAELLGGTSPSARQILGGAPPAGYFHVAVVAAGGNLFGAVPIPG
jgi:hypothetical protein